MPGLRKFCLSSFQWIHKFYLRPFISEKQGHELYVPQVSSCVQCWNDMTISDYRQALASSTPGLTQLTLRDCLLRVHTEILTCWNFRGTVLNC